MTTEPTGYLDAAGDYLASLGAGSLEPAVRDDMVNMADLAVYLLLSRWLVALQDDDPNSMQVIESLGDLGQALQRETLHGEASRC